ncbi:hypothetical protein SELMODRAFT_19179, partial [Selaginella moellendorffii]
YKLIMQNDCNLVLYYGNIAKWSSRTNGKGLLCKIILQSDGNLVIYNEVQSIWHTNTYCGVEGCIVPSFLSIQNDCNIVLY